MPSVLYRYGASVGRSDAKLLTGIVSGTVVKPVFEGVAILGPETGGATCTAGVGSVGNDATCGVLTDGDDLLSN